VYVSSQTFEHRRIADGDRLTVVAQRLRGDSIWQVTSIMEHDKLRGQSRGPPPPPRAPPPPPGPPPSVPIVEEQDLRLSKSMPDLPDTRKGNGATLQEFPTEERTISAATTSTGGSGCVSIDTEDAGHNSDEEFRDAEEELPWYPVPAPAKSGRNTKGVVEVLRAQQPKPSVASPKAGSAARRQASRGVAAGSASARGDRKRSVPPPPPIPPPAVLVAGGGPSAAPSAVPSAGPDAGPHPQLKRVLAEPPKGAAPPPPGQDDDAKLQALEARIRKLEAELEAVRPPDGPLAEPFAAQAVQEYVGILERGYLGVKSGDQLWVTHAETERCPSDGAPDPVLWFYGFLYDGGGQGWLPARCVRRAAAAPTSAQ